MSQHSCLRMNRVTASITSVSNLNPTLLNRYITAAQKISRLALGHIGRSPEGHTVRIRGDVTQDGHRFDGLPLGTRGGAVVRWNFPVDGEYQVQIRLMRDRNDELEGLKGKHQLDLLLDRQHFHTFEIQRPTASRDDHEVDASLIAKFTTTAGEHELGVTFHSRAARYKKPIVNRCMCTSTSIAIHAWLLLFIRSQSPDRLVRPISVTRPVASGSLSANRRIQPTKMPVRVRSSATSCDKLIDARLLIQI